MSIGLYIHVPFCIKKCNYCSFVSVPRDIRLISQFLDALVAEMKIRTAALSSEERVVDSIYIGGGTPTCLSGESLAQMLARVRHYFDVTKEAEISVEANPGTVDQDALNLLKRSGYNRLSFGFQSCQQEHLKTLGRIHSYQEAVASFQAARSAGFDNINVDLIFGIPGQTLRQWQDCLQKIVSLGPEHISAYGLQIEEETPLYKRVLEGTMEPCSEDLEAEMYQSLMDILTASGYVHYEISNFSLPGRFSRHNLRYWQNKSYLGLGPAAHSYLGRKRLANDSSLEGYLEKLATSSSPVSWEEIVTPESEMSETVFLGLRLAEGLDLEGFMKRFGKALDQVYPEQIKKLSGLGLVEKAGNRLRLTKQGMMLGNIVFVEFV